MEKAPSVQIILIPALSEVCNFGLLCRQSEEETIYVLDHAHFNRLTKPKSDK